jgi:hypothetical protein
LTGNANILKQSYETEIGFRTISDFQTFAPKPTFKLLSSRSSSDLAAYIAVVSQQIDFLGDRGGFGLTFSGLGRARTSYFGVGFSRA